MSNSRPIQGMNLAKLQNNIGKVFSEMTGLTYEASIIEIDFEPSGQNHVFSDETELKLRLITPGSAYHGLSEEERKAESDSF